MKKADIVIGACYSNGKGRIRKVLDIGPQYKYYDSAECEENLRYEIIHDGTKGNLCAGEMSNMSAQSFSSWAKERVEDYDSISFFPAIAYYDKDERGFSESSTSTGIGHSWRFYVKIPFIEDSFDTVDEAKDRAREMEAEGFQNVRVFALPRDERLRPDGDISSTYVDHRLII